MNFTITVEVLESWVSAMLCDFFEAGVDSWWEFYKPKPYRCVDDCNKVILPCVLQVRANNDGSELEERVLTREGIEKALVTMVVQYPHDFADIVTQDYDYETCDVLLQLAIFGEIVFG